MKALTTTAIVLNLLLVQMAPCVADDVVPGSHISSIATLDDIVDSPQRMSARITNHGSKRIENVRLLVSYGWLWNDDRRTDKAPAGWTELHTVPVSIEAGRSAPFAVEHQQWRPTPDDGQFLMTVKVVGLTEWEFRTP
jgi:hypothetical protein